MTKADPYFRITLSISLKVRSPFLFKAETPDRWGIDAVPMRNQDGMPIIPQDQVRGVLRQALRDVLSSLGEGSDIEGALFGQASGDASELGRDAPSSAFEPSRARIIFADLVAKEKTTPRTAVRLKIDPETETAAAGALQFVELAAPRGADVLFEGQAIVHATGAEWAIWGSRLAAAPSWVGAIGAMKSIGFGQVVDDSFKIREERKVACVPKPNANVKAVHRFEIRLDRPFLVNANRAAGNVFKGDPVIPGAVIKGALAQKLLWAGELKKHVAALAEMRISHAKHCHAPREVPASIYTVTVQGDDGEPEILVRDALTSQLGSSLTETGALPRFKPDHKDDDDTAIDLVLSRQRPILKTEFRTHVRILPETGTAAESDLYVNEAIVPGADDSWCFEVQPHHDYPASNAVLLTTLVDGLDSIGKTHAAASLAEQLIGTDVAPRAVPISGFDDHFAVVLETACMMVDSLGDETAFDKYAEYWRDVCPNAKLVSFFATQSAMGGFVARRFREADYYPFLLTDPGSVFVLAGNIKNELESLMKTGLPASTHLGQSTSWKTCPYQPQNGYGAFTADYDAALKVGE